MSIADTIIGFVAPHTCIGCAKEGSVLCVSCTDMYFEPVQSRCVGCKTITEDFKVCTSCRSWLPLRSVYICGQYEGAVELLVRSLKFECQRAAAKAMAGIMTNQLTPQNETVLCPIPTAPARIRERGFDHALLIAKELSKQAGLPCQQMLRRHTNTRQLGASRSARIKQMKKEFEQVSRQEIDGKHIVLVDDVFTTGATIASAAKVLRQAGAKRVSAIVFSQKL